MREDRSDPAWELNKKGRLREKTEPNTKMKNVIRHDSGKLAAFLCAVLLALLSVLPCALRVSATSADSASASPAATGNTPEASATLPMGEMTGGSPSATGTMPDGEHSGNVDQGSDGEIGDETSAPAATSAPIPAATTVADDTEGTRGGVIAAIIAVIVVVAVILIVIAVMPKKKP